MKIIIDVPESATQGKPWDYARAVREVLNAGQAGINSDNHTIDTPIQSAWVSFEIGGDVAAV